MIEAAPKHEELEFLPEAEALIHAADAYLELRTPELKSVATQLSLNSLVYIRCLRLLGAARWQDRQSSRQEVKNVEVADWNGEWLYDLTPRKLGRIALQFSDEIKDIITRLGREKRQTDAILEDLLPHQQLYVADIMASLRLPHKTIEVMCDDGPEAYHVRGATVVAPTGIGKTVFMARAALGLGIGGPADSGPNEGGSRRALVIVPDQALVEQFTGRVGDDTFRRFGPKDINVTSYYARDKDDTGDVVVITIDKFVDDFCNGTLNGNNFDLVMIDEVHSLTRPKFLKRFLEHWRGPTLGFTATPDYRPTKDSRTILPHVINHTDILSCIEKGVLNGAQLFTLQLNAEALKAADVTARREIARQMRDETTLDLLMSFLAEGRRGMVFCDPGVNQQSNLTHAQELAGQIAMLPLPDGRKVNVAALSAYNPSSGPGSNKEMIQRYHNGEIDVLTTTHIGTQGFNADIDFVVLPDVNSFLKLRQAIGRGTRLSKRFPITIYCQIITPIYPGAPRQRSYSVYEAFGLEEVRQGWVVTAKTGSDEKKETGGRLSPSAFSPEIQAMMREADQKKIGEIILRSDLRDYDIPSTYISFEVIAKAAGIPLASHTAAKHRLDAAGYQWRGRYDMERRGMIRYYEPGAATFFTEKPLPPRAPENYRAAKEIAAILGITDFSVRSLLSRHPEIEGVPMIGQANEALHYDDDALEKIAQLAAEELPLAKPGDITVGELAEELGCSEKLITNWAKARGIQSQYRRRPDEDLYHAKTKRRLSRHDADVLRAAVTAYPKAAPTDVTGKQLSVDAFGYDNISKLKYHLTEAEAQQAVIKWVIGPDGRQKLRDTWTPPQAKAIVERIKDEYDGKVPLHLIPCISLDDFFSVRYRTVTTYLSKLPDEQRIGGVYERFLGERGKPKICLTWQMLEKLEKSGRFTRRDSAIEIDYTRLPQGPDDHDPQRLAYAKEIHARLVPQEWWRFVQEELNQS